MALELAPFGREALPWRSDGRQARTVTSYEAFVPPLIGDMETTRLLPSSELDHACREAEVFLKSRGCRKAEPI